MQSNIYQQLTNRIIDSDKEAFEKLFHLLHPSLVSFAYKYMKDKSVANDIVQEAFINVWNIRAELTRNQSIKTYMFRTVRNLSLNHIRDRSRVSNGLEVVNLTSDETMFQEESDHVYDNKRATLMRVWICQLPDRQQEVLKMSRFEGLAHDEIADVLDISKRTVNNHIVQAMKNLKKYHDEYSEMNV